jgi:hypothetical protein
MVRLRELTSSGARQLFPDDCRVVAGKRGVMVNLSAMPPECGAPERRVLG